MGYYIRLITKSAIYPAFKDIEAHCSKFKKTENAVVLEKGQADDWKQIYVETSDKNPILTLDRERRGGGGIFEAEIGEFVDFLDDLKPQNAANWVKAYLGAAEQIFAVQFHNAAFEELYGNMPSDLLEFLRNYCGGIIQADFEGWSNEDGYHIVWEFSDTVSGQWKCAVLKDGSWVNFEMDLGDKIQRQEFQSGQVPSKARNVRRN